ncbi:n-acetyltransferase gcn5 [Stylonychia lemnae]|uniref:N-acetyltransferase gcn5 n=1 Tax=Stylonychia lemnae TaxID=5949 RepID=A0A078B873_STYLE|nr:n-acetyltransferase gcn5 [Stylonychia lemnae]|eukprot:CDW89487.1 n-acetyltransferase gcn5 [Stylonychia lemnae]
MLFLNIFINLLKNAQGIHLTQQSSKGFDSHNENSEIIANNMMINNQGYNQTVNSSGTGAKPKIFRISSNKIPGFSHQSSMGGVANSISKPSHGYISKLPSNPQNILQKKNTKQKAQLELDNFVLESIPKQIVVVPKAIDQQLSQNELESQSIQKGHLDSRQSDNQHSPTDQWKEQQQLIENFYNQRYGSKQNSGGVSTEEKRVKFMQQQNNSESQIQYDKELLDENIVGRINAKLEQEEQSPDKKNPQNMIQKNILQQSSASEYQITNDLGQIPPNIPFSNMALFTNLSEKERFIKFSTEFNKVKAQLEAHRHEDYSICLLYLKAKIGYKIAEPTRDQVKNFMKFVKDEKRLFDLRKQYEEIIIEAMDGLYSYERAQEYHERKRRAQTAEIADTLQNHQQKLLEMLEQQKINRRRNKLHYQRKVPYGNQPMKLQTIMSSYIDENKKLSAKEFIPPSLENQYPCAVNFNKETVNTVLNFAQESKVHLMSSMSTNNLSTKPTSSAGQNILSDIKRNRSAVNLEKISREADGQAHNSNNPMTPYQQHRHQHGVPSNSMLKSQSQVVISNISQQQSDQKAQMQSSHMSQMHSQSQQQQSSQIENEKAYQKISKLNNVESESVFKRNRLMLEHVMLERAMKKLNKRQERKEARKLQENNGGTNDWKMRQAISNEVFEMQRQSTAPNRRGKSGQQEFNIQVKVATIEDKDHVLYLMNENAKLIGGYEKEKFEFAGEYVLKNEHYGFFILAFDERSQQDEEQSSGQDMKRAAGFMFFTYEWSDWRSGLFFWMQSCHVAEEYRKAGVFTKMHELLQKVMTEKNCCGIRLNSEIRLEKQWAPIVNKLGLKRAHYHIYEIDVAK